MEDRMTAVEAYLADDLPRTLRTGAEVTRMAPAASSPVALTRDTLIANGVFGFEHLDVRAHTFVLLRSQVINRFYRPGGRVLAVTSTRPGNGKTYITANLAAALSRIHPTVLIDLDLRRPTLASRLGLSPVLGVDDYLAGDASWEDVRTQIAAVDLSVFGVRQPRQNSATLLANERLGGMLDALRTLPEAPICIVDTPPILVLDDIMLISQSVDGVLMVIEEGATRGEDLAEALRILSPTPIVGSVLNKSITGGPPASGYGDYYPVS
jgi:protein-tyrosine kinase